MFTKATRTSSFIKLAICGPSGSGKTYSALRLARGLSPDGKIAVIDSENGSASLYSSDFDFDVSNVSPPFSVDKLIHPVNHAVENGYAVLIIDSSSHFWNEVLEMKHQLDQRGGNSFTNWKSANKFYDSMLKAILFSEIHVICCMRSKMDYVLEENEKGKTVPRKVGMAPVMRDGVEYEFSTVFDIDMNHHAMVSKDRTNLFVDKIFQISEETGRTIAEWLEGGVDPIEAIRDEFESIGNELYGETWKNKRSELVRHISNGKHENSSQLTENQLQRLLDGMRKLMRPEPELDEIG